MPSRTIAIGDVHGCLAALDALIDAVSLNADDTLVMLGDVVDRGPESCQAIERLIELSKEFKVVTILGNHEEMMIAASQQRLLGIDWLDCGGRATLQSFGVATPSEIPDSYISFVDEWCDYYETDTHFFAHGNYDSALPLDDQPWDELRWQPLRFTVPGQHMSGKQAVLGHTAQKSGEPLWLSQLVCIDTHCYGGGWLTAFCPETDEIWQANAQGQLRVAAEGK